MSREKEKLQISASALVELKATLFSKQREVRSKDKKTHTADVTAVSTNTVSEKTSAIWRKPPKQRRGGRTVGGGGVRERDTQRSAEEEAELERSRKALEAKAALYDRLCEGEGLRRGGSDDSEGEEEEEGRYMVDFTRKIAEEQKAKQEAAASSADHKESDVKEGVAEEEGEWVEYVDSFGRTRRCPTEDLPHVQAEEQKRRERSVTPDLLSDDMAMERERRQWEREQAEELDKPLGPVHYQEMRQGEVRSHGVGYYAFSMDEEKRSDQLNLLNKLRDQTVHQREKKLKLQEKRKALMDARLAKIRERKQLKQSAVEEGEKAGSAKGEKEGGGEGTEGEMVDPIAAMIESELGRAREKAEKTGEGGGEGEEDTGRKKKPYVRPWDKGKVVDPIRKRKKELEDERLPEFAPPSSYAKTTPQLKQVKVDQTEQQAPSLANATHEPPNLVPQQDGTSVSNSSNQPVLTQNQYQQQTMPQMPYAVPYPYPPPNMLFYNGQPLLFRPPPPPPNGPIPSGQPPYYYPYFQPPPPPHGVPPSHPQS